MRNRIVLAIAGLTMLAVSITAIASNMGFKISIPLKAGWNNYVSIPYYTSYTDADSLWTDIPNCTQVMKWDNTKGTFLAWNHYRGTNFTVSPGDAYVIIVSADSTWIVVGSNNPNQVLTLKAGYNNYISVPYNTTAADADALISEIPNATQVMRWDNTRGTFMTWNGFRGTNFSLTPGEGLVVIVSADSTWQPSHY